MQIARKLPTTVTVAEALRLALPPGTRVARGHHGLPSAISWVRAFITRPWPIGSIEPGALVILSFRGPAGRSEVQALPRLVEALAAAQVSAIVLSEDFPEFVDAAGHEDTLPVLILPPDAGLVDVERAVIGLILDREGQVHRRANEIYQLLMQLALEDAPTQAMAEALAETTGRVIYLENEYGILQSVASPSEREGFGLPSASEATTIYSSRQVLGISAGAPAVTPYSAGALRRVIGGSGWAVCSSPISLGGTVAGFLTLLGSAGEIRDLDEQIVIRAASAFAVPIAKHRAIMETQTRLQGSFLENLLGGTFSDEEEIAVRARYLGHDLHDPYDTACLTLDDHLDSQGPLDEAQRAGLWTSFLDLAHRDLFTRWPRALLRERGDVLAVLVPALDGAPPGHIRAYFENTRVHLSTLVGGARATVGLGKRSAGPHQIVRSYAEAEQAARIGRQFLGGNRTVSFEELGVYRVIAGVDDREALDAFRREYLGAVEEYDSRHSAELVDTLEGFFACNGNHARAAEMLHLHRNTLLYRLERIETLTGLDLGDAETRLSLQLALKIRRVFPTLQASQPRKIRGARS